MRKVAKLLSTCFRRSKVDCDSVEEAPIAETQVEEARTATRRPPVFPTTTRAGNKTREYRPHSPFETRLRRLGQKIEDEVSKEDCGSEGSRLRGSRLQSDGESLSSGSSWRCLRGADLNTSDSVLSSTLSENKRESRKLVFASLDSSEPEVCTRLEEELIPSNNFWMCNTSSCASTASLRDLTHTQYLFYEDEDDVVMEFYPSVRVIQQAS